MRYVLTGEQMREAEAEAVAAGHALGDLMERAGAALAAEAAVRVPEGRIVIAAGHGNNGGDGWVAGRYLVRAGREVLVVALRDIADLPVPADAAARAAIEAGVPYRVASSDADLVLAFADAAMIVDALLGIGSRGEPRPPYADAIAAINDAGAVVMAADLPSGVDADTGGVPGIAVVASATVTFSALKPGLLLQPGASCAGEIVVADIGLPPAAPAPGGSLEAWGWEEYADLLPLPGPLVHKHSRGSVLIVGGAPGMTGAVCLAADGALRCGAGHVTVAVPAPSLGVVEVKLTAPVKLAIPAGPDGDLSRSAADAILAAADRCDAVVIGPGLGRSASTAEAVMELLERLTLPVVLDADALWALGENGLDAVGRRGAPTVLTPHAGEAGRLLGLEGDAIDADRPSAVRALAACGAVAVLKGPATLIAGSGRVVVNPTGGPSLATLGTGDVLAGMIGALLAQGLPPLEACALAAYLHGAAGDAAASDLTPVCCTAEDVVAYLPEAVRPLLERRT
ncbi:MAG: NAD(P)H-hydrate dehydratase [Coriobacteriia bacterium]|nr:NAD(P)H-hydrate dehydratase [Coriobacteriia bacterium]